MCWMMIKKAGTQPNFKYMDKAQEHNPDGYGVSWFEDKMVQTYKTFDYNQFKGVVAALKKHTLVIHLRYATKGNKSYNNIHPFEVPSGVMFHNGTMFGLGDYTKSDSQELANTISECEYKYIEDIQPLIKPYIDDKINRLVFFEDNGRITIMNEQLGINEEGNWYSNDYHLKNEGWCRAGCKPRTTTPVIVPKKENKPLPKLYTVFVYGTLKKGYGNHGLLEKATFLGKAKTENRWAMVGQGKAFPYLLEENDRGYHVLGEVYAVDSTELARLDQLEGVPYHYRKQEIIVNYSDDLSSELVTVYTKSQFFADYAEKSTMIENWSEA